MMPDYERAAATYDETRGGVARAEAAAEATAPLLPQGRCLDVGGGTGLVALGLLRRGVDVVVLDRSPAMLGLAATRLPGRCVRADASRLPVAASSVDAVLTMWLLHLLDDARPVLDEAARVLRPGGVLVTTVDKAAAHGYRDDQPTDREADVVTYARALGLRPGARASYVGHGQGRGGGPDPVYPVLTLRLVG